jgi:hypothetical protein
MLLEPGRKYPRTEGATIIFENPARAHKVIAIIEGDGHQSSNQSQIVRAMQRKAARIGAHAILLTSTESQYVPTTTHANPVAGGAPLTIAGGTKYKMKAVAIRYTD